MRIWMLTGGRRGNQVICEGVAQALANLSETKADITPHIVALRGVWRLLRRTRLASLYVQWRGDKAIAPPYPDIVLASGAATIAHARAIRAASHNKSFVVYLQDPHIAPRHFDFIWTPEHDPIKGANVFKTLLSPHGLSPATLAHEAEAWRTRLIPAGFSGGVVGFSMGGANRAYPFTAADMARIAAQLAQVAAQGHLILTAPSRRTNPAHIDILRTHLAPYPHYIWQPDEETDDNPYAAILGLADQLIITADSVNMIGEACTTGKPVHIAALTGGNRKFNRFHASLKQAGIVRDFTGALAAPAPSTTPANPTEEIAAAIYSAMQAENRL